MPSKKSVRVSFVSSGTEFVLKKANKFKFYPNAIWMFFNIYGFLIESTISNF